MKKQDKIFIAGHKGLVGSAILKKLNEKGYSNLVCRNRGELDLINQEEVRKFFQTEKPDCVILAAAKVGGIQANNTYRADFIYENLMIQSNVIHQSFLSGISKLLFLGSSCVYPKDVSQPIMEDSLLTSELEYTNEPYAVAKIAGIKMCESYNLQYGTNFISVMPTNLYGPNDNFDLEKSHVLPALMRKIYLAKCLEDNDWEAIKLDLNRYPVANLNQSSKASDILIKLKEYGIMAGEVEIWGSGKPRREFLWSEDMADACIFLLENINFNDTFIVQDSAIRNTHINIGTGDDISIIDLASLIKNIIGYSGGFRFNLSKPDGTIRKLTDVTKLHQLGWKHSVNLAEGVRKMYECCFAK